MVGVVKQGRVVRGAAICCQALCGKASLGMLKRGVEWHGPAGQGKAGYTARLAVIPKRGVDRHGSVGHGSADQAVIRRGWVKRGPLESGIALYGSLSLSCIVGPCLAVWSAVKQAAIMARFGKVLFGPVAQAKARCRKALRGLVWRSKVEYGGARRCGAWFGDVRRFLLWCSIAIKGVAGGALQGKVWCLLAWPCAAIKGVVQRSFARKGTVR